jgi:hypothetical protein
MVDLSQTSQEEDESDMIVDKGRNSQSMHTPPPPIKQGNKRKAKVPLVNDSEPPHKIRGLLVGIVCEYCNSKVVTRGTSLFMASKKQIETHFTNCSHSYPSNLKEMLFSGLMSELLCGRAKAKCPGRTLGLVLG